MKRSLFLMIIALLSAPVLPGNARAAFLAERYKRPAVKNFSPFDYSGHGQVWDIIQGSDGVIYFANTYTGILIYDGTYWRRVVLKKSMTMRSLGRDNEGVIYSGGKGDFGYLKKTGGVTEFVSLLEHVPEQYRSFGNVWQVLVSGQGIYFVTYRHIFRWFNKKIEVIETASRFYPAGRVFDKLYVLQRDSGLMRIEGSSLVPVPDAESFRKKNIIANVFIPYEMNSIIVASRDRGCFIYDGKKLRPFHTEANRYLVRNLVYSSALLPGNLMAFGTKRGGLIIIDKEGKIKSIINKKYGLRDNHLLSMFVDSYNGLWLGLNNGISRVDFFSPFSSFGESSGYSGSVLSILRQNGKLYLATSLGLYEENLKAGTGGVFFRKIPGINGQVKKLVEADGSFLAATLFGVYLVSRGKTDYRISHDTIYDMIRSRKRPELVFTLVTGKGVQALQKLTGRWISRGIISGIADNISAIAGDQEGNIWMATENGEIIKGSFGILDNIFKEEKRFPHSNMGSNIRISFVSGKLLFTTERGIFSYDPGEERFRTEGTIGKFFANKDIIEVIENPGGSVWVREGILFHIYYAEREKGGSYSLNDVPFFGLQKFRCYTVYNDSEGLVWFGGPRGLTAYNRKQLRSGSAAYPPLISRIEANGSTFYGGKGEKADFLKSKKGETGLPGRYNSLRFYYSSPFYYDESRNQYQVKLENYDKEWSSWSTAADTLYHSLPPGSYEFRVRARNTGTQISETGVYGFTIYPPWYKSWWAFFVYIAGAFLLYRGGKYIRLRINIIREKIFEMEVERILQNGTYKKTKDNKSLAMNHFSQDNNLTRREEEILSHIIEGMSTNDIANLLRISPTTAKKHIQNLYEKTGTHSRIEIFTEFYKYIEKK